jgi:hypothetical protein
MTSYLPLAVAVLATAVLLVIEHWAVQHIHQGPFPPAFNYSIGSLAVLAGFGLWGILTGDLAAVVALALIYGVAGGLIILMYLAEEAVAGEGHKQEATALRDVVRDAKE